MNSCDGELDLRETIPFIYYCSKKPGSLSHLVKYFRNPLYFEGNRVGTIANGLEEMNSGTERALLGSVTLIQALGSFIRYQYREYRQRSQKRLPRRCAKPHRGIAGVDFAILTWQLLFSVLIRIDVTNKVAKHREEDSGFAPPENLPLLVKCHGRIRS